LIIKNKSKGKPDTEEKRKTNTAAEERASGRGGSGQLKG
jgi:hypothetical protein